MLWIGFDVGGTFTDLVSLDLRTGRVTAAKAPSSATEPALAARRGIARLLDLGGHQPGEVSRVVHGTTIATNSLIELDGARVGFICNRGYRDVVEIGRMFREELFDIDFTKTPPLVPRNLREEVIVRDGVDGRPVAELDEESVRQAVRRLLDLKVEAIAVGLLHAYVNPNHENRIRELIHEQAPDMVVSLSHEVSREYGEHERWTTTIVNAYLAPKIRGYLRDLEVEMRDLGIDVPVETMQSNGGLATVAVAAQLPVRLLESGPAGGIAGIVHFAEQFGFDRIITLDIGGTSTDVSVILDRKPTITTERAIGGHPVRAVMADIHSIGAGGGSIAAVDSSGTLHVGPHSAGADPGPVAIGQGGTAPTVTDADVVLGYLNPDRYCAGERDRPLDLPGARAAILRTVGEPSGTSPEQAALGVLLVTVRNMVSAIRSITTQRGLDPRDFVLVACGGAGPVHAGLVAEELRIPRVMIPSYPALLSARGMLMADHRTDLSLSYPSLLSNIDGDRLTALFAELEAAAVDYLPGMDGDTDTDTDVTVERIVEVCYDGQQHTIPLSVPAGRLSNVTVKAIGTQLDEWFRGRYGFVPASNVPKLVNLRVFLSKNSDTIERIRRMEMRDESRVAVPAVSSRRMVFRSHPDGIDTPIYDRAQLAGGASVDGPCVIEEDFSTTVVYPGQRAEVDQVGNIFILTEVAR